MSRFSIFVALRYLRARKRRKSVSVSTLVSIVGIAVGVTVLLTVLGVMTGYTETLRDKILSVSSHMLVMDYGGWIKDDPEKLMGELEGVDGVEAASPFVLGQVMLTSGYSASGVYVRGVDPAREGQTTSLKTYITAGSFEALSDDSIVLGATLAEELGVKPGDTVKMVSPFGGAKTSSGPTGRMKKFTVAGVFRAGMHEFDSRLAVTSIEGARDFLDVPEGAISGIEVRLKDPARAEEASEAAVRALGGYPYYARNWIEMNRNLFSALRMQKVTLFVVLALIVLVAAFNVVSSQVMNVMEKEREIAILRAMGATSGSIVMIFLIQSFMVGFAGTMLGLLGGLGMVEALDTLKIVKLPPDVYFLSHLPARAVAGDFAAVCGSAFVISLLASIYPAIRAGAVSPAEPLRYK